MLNKKLLAVAVATALAAGCGGTTSVSDLDNDQEPQAIDVDNNAGAGPESTEGEGAGGSDIGGGDGVVDENANEGSGDNQTGSGNGTGEASDGDGVDSGALDNGDNPVDDNETGGGDSGVVDDAPEVNTTVDDDDAVAGSPPPVGLLDTAQPEFVWPAVANAEQYKIVVTDSGGSGYARALDPMSANCQTGEGNCRATTNLAYYDNDLTWHVESTVNGAQGPVSDSFSITTPLSENLQPIKSSDGGCEAWAAVAYGKYVVLNNSWNSRAINDQSWFQLINVTENANGTISPAWAYDWRGQFDGDEIAVKAYPEVLYGPKLGTHVSGTREETGLPAKVSELPEFVVSYDYSETGNAERNVALESFFHDSDDIRGPCDDDDNRVYEMMIWVNNPSIRTPGKLALTGVMVDNQLWNVYIKPDSNKHYIAFTAQNPTTSGTLNWKRFVDWTRDWTAANAEERRIDVLDPGFHMGAIEIGTEMWWGEGTFTLNNFEVTF